MATTNNCGEHAEQDDHNRLDVVTAIGGEDVGTDDDVMCLDFVEDVAPIAWNDFPFVEEMERAERLCENMRKMCRKFDGSMALSMHWIM